METHILPSIPIFFPRNSWRLCGQATDNNITRRMRFSSWITKDRDTQSEYVILIAFPLDNGYANVPHCYAYTFFNRVAGNEPQSKDLQNFMKGLEQNFICQYHQLLK